MTLDEAARTFLGVPFRHQGRDPSIGIDCIGLVVLSGRMAGHPLAEGDRTDYSTDPHDGLLEDGVVATLGQPLPKSEMQPGDVVTIDFKGTTRHVGIISERGGALYLIHTAQRVGNDGRVTEHRIDAKWFKRITGVYRPEQIA